MKKLNFLVQGYGAGTLVLAIFAASPESCLNPHWLLEIRKNILLALCYYSISSFRPRRCRDVCGITGGLMDNLQTLSADNAATEGVQQIFQIEIKRQISAMWECTDLQLKSLYRARIHVLVAISTYSVVLAIGGKWDLVSIRNFEIALCNCASCPNVAELDERCRQVYSAHQKVCAELNAFVLFGTINTVTESEAETARNNAIEAERRANNCRWAIFH
jgi:hypothetical protein